MRDLLPTLVLMAAAMGALALGTRRSAAGEARRGAAPGSSGSSGDEACGTCAAACVAPPRAPRSATDDSPHTLSDPQGSTAP